MKTEKNNCPLYIHASEIRELNGTLSETEKEDLKKCIRNRIRQKGRIDDMKKQQRRWSRLQIAAACILAVVLIPATVFAAQRLTELYQTKVSENGMQKKITIEKNDTKAEKPKYEEENYASNEERLEAYVQNAQVKNFVQVKFEKEKFLPEYICADSSTMDFSTEVDTYAKRWFIHKQEKENNKNFFVELYYVPKQVSFDEINQNTCETLTVDGHKAYYMEEKRTGSGVSKYTTATPLTLYVFYPEYNYYLKYSGEENLKKKDLVHYANLITLKSAKKNQADEFWLAQDFQHEVSYQEDQKVYGTIHKWGDKIKVDGVEYLVKKVEVRDSIKGLKKKEFHNYSDYFQLDVWRKNGKLKPYKRERYIRGDGVREPREQVVDSKMIQPKLLYITLQMTNTTKKKKYSADNLGVHCLKKTSGNSYEFLPDNYYRDTDAAIGLAEYEPMYFEGAKEIGEDEWKQVVAAGETKVFHIGFFMDEDFVKSCHLNISDSKTNTVDKKGHYISRDYLPLSR